MTKFRDNLLNSDNPLDLQEHFYDHIKNVLINVFFSKKLKKRVFKKLTCNFTQNMANTVLIVEVQL